MSAVNRLIDELKNASEGSPELDQQIVDVIYPGKQVGGPLSYYTRSLDAKLPGEEIIRVERLKDGNGERWRAWLVNNWTADGRTEILARRLAQLSYMEFEQRIGTPQLREPYSGRPSQQERARRKSSSSSGADTREAEQFANQQLIIEALCDQLRTLKCAAPVSTAVPLIADVEAAGDSQIIVRSDPRYQPVPTDVGTGSSATLSDAIAIWRTEAKPRVRNIARISRTARRFIELYGDRPMNSYTKAEVRDFLAKIRRVPRRQPNELKGMPLPALIKYTEKHREVETATPATVRAYLKDIQLIFNWGISWDLCAINPANNLRVIDRRFQSEKRVAYDLEDLKTIFERSPLYAGCLTIRQRRIPGKLIFKDSLFWFGLFGLFTGARLGEIANATVDDFKCEQDIHFLDIHAARDNRHLKTQAADRQVPIHLELIRIGFLDYVARQRAKGYRRVFEEMQGRRNIRSAESWSQAWQIYQGGIGIDDRRKVFYSFRHTFKRACRDVGIEEEVHDVLTGHRGYWSGRRYGEGVSLKTLAGAIAKVQYFGLDLSHLYEHRN